MLGKETGAICSGTALPFETLGTLHQKASSIVYLFL